MQSIKGLFLVLLMFLVGGALLSPINTSFSPTIIVTPTYSAAVVSMSGLPVIVFMLIIILKGFDSI